MQALLIVKVYILAQSFSRFPGTEIVFSRDLFIFDGTPQAFRKNSSERATFAIHTDAHIVGREPTACTADW
jgi:hypothetical protein